MDGIPAKSSQEPRQVAENFSNISEDSSVDTSMETPILPINPVLRNSEHVLCCHCPCKILVAGTVTHVKKKVFLPNVTSKSAIPRVAVPSTVLDAEDGVLYTIPGVEGEVVEDFWLVADMFTFENVGVSNAVGTLKYLTCADCERGPIGYHDISNKDEYFVAWSRVRNNAS